MFLFSSIFLYKPNVTQWYRKLLKKLKPAQPVNKFFYFKKTENHHSVNKIPSLDPFLCQVKQILTSPGFVFILSSPGSLDLPCRIVSLYFPAEILFAFLSYIVCTKDGLWIVLSVLSFNFPFFLHFFFDSSFLPMRIWVVKAKDKGVPVLHAMRHIGVMEVQLHASAALPPGKEPLVPIG
jgi:hypothetical protein